MTILLILITILTVSNLIINYKNNMMSTTPTIMIINSTYYDDESHNNDSTSINSEHNDSICIFIPSYQRPINLDISLPYYNSLDIVSEIVVAHGKNGRFYHDSFKSKKIKHIKDWTNNNKYFTIRRYITSTQYCHNNNIMLIDDDILPSNKYITKLFNLYKNDVNNFYGLTPRICTIDGYKGEYGHIKVNEYNTILSGLMITSKQVLINVRNNFRNTLFEQTIINNKGNGEDLMFNYYFIKLYKKKPVLLRSNVNLNYTVSFLKQRPGFSRTTKNHSKIRHEICKEFYANFTAPWLDTQSITIITSDNREMTASNYASLTAVINYLYAKKYGYNFIYYKWHTQHNNEHMNKKPKFDIICPHSKYGSRSAPWCKLISIYHALYYSIYSANNSMVVYLDSDAAFFNHNIDIEYYLKTMNYSIYHTDSALITSINFPWSIKSTSGSMIFKNNIISKCILTKWWNDNNISCSNYYMKHGRRIRRLHDQHCLQTVITDCYANYISVLNDRTFIFSKNQFWRHVGSNQKQQRMKIFEEKLNSLIVHKPNKLTLNESKIIKDTVAMYLDEIKNYHTVYMDKHNPSKKKLESEYNPNSKYCRCK
eukprot:497502_1